MYLPILVNSIILITFCEGSAPFIPGQGCPRIKPNGFDESKYTGLWYDIASIPSSQDSSESSCVWSQYTETSSKSHLRVVNSEVRPEKGPSFGRNPKFGHFGRNHKFGHFGKFGNFGKKFGKNKKSKFLKTKFLKSKLDSDSDSVHSGSKLEIYNQIKNTNSNSKTKRFYSLGEVYLSPKIDGELHVTMLGNSDEFANRYTILDTDNKSYSYVWSCTSVCLAAKCFANRPNLWILNRNFNLSEKEVFGQVENAFEILENSGYNTTTLYSYMEIKNQTNCGYEENKK